jgi:hypothetical protein
MCLLTSSHVLAVYSGTHKREIGRPWCGQSVNEDLKCIGLSRRGDSLHETVKQTWSVEYWPYRLAKRLDQPDSEDLLQKQWESLAEFL